MLLDVCDQPFLVLAHSEEIIRLAELLDRPLALRTQAADDIFLSPEPFVEGAIPACIGPLVNFAFVIQLLQRLLYYPRVARLRRADKVVVRDVQPFPQFHELRCQPVTMRLWRNPGLGRRLLNLLSMLVEAGQKEDVILAQSQPVVSCQDVCGNRRISVPDMRDVVDIIDRRCDVKRLLHDRV